MMRRRFVLLAGLGFALGHVFVGPMRRAEAGETATRNGDVNGDGALDLADAIYILQFLFARGPASVPLEDTSTKRPLPATAQVLCYDTQGDFVDCDNEDWPGQDGFHQAGCPSEGRFIDNGDGTVTDACTGLMWQQNTADIDGDGEVTPDVLSGVDNPDVVTWQEALDYCENLEFAGHSDWRLPDIRELESIRDYGRDDPAPSIDPVFGAEKRRYWTSTSLLLHEELACVVAFNSCNVFSEAEKVKDDLPFPCFVRAVRRGCASGNGDVNADDAVDIGDAITILGYLFAQDPLELQPACSAGTRSSLPETGQTTCYDATGAIIDCVSDTCPGQDGFYATGCPQEGRFIDNGDGTVTDTCTGLMWQRETADIHGNGPEEVTWQEALNYCENLEFAGHGDWRLPNVRELESIVDHGRRDPCIDPVFEVESSAYWTSTTLVGFTGVAGGPEHAWFVAFWYGTYLYHYPKDDQHLVLAVRNAR